jgi:hypothetical protein
LDEAAAAVGVFLEIHISSLGLSRTPLRRDRNIVMGFFVAGARRVLIRINRNRTTPEAGGPIKASTAHKYGNWMARRKSQMPASGGKITR